MLAAGALALITMPVVDVPALGPVLLWDLGGIAGVIGLVATFLVTSVVNTHALFIEETKR